MAEGAPVPKFFNIDSRVPAAPRDLLVEADGCAKMGFLLGGTVCAQRALRALLALEGCDGASETARLDALGRKHPDIPKVLFAVCARLGESPVSDQPLPSDHLNLLTVTLKLILHEIYVIALERADGLKYVQQILEHLENEDAARPSPVLAFAKQ